MVLKNTIRVGSSDILEPLGYGNMGIVLLVPVGKFEETGEDPGAACRSSGSLRTFFVDIVRV